MSINEMFTTANAQSTISSRALEGSAQLISTANEYAAKAINKLNDELDTYSELFEQSKENHSAMDKLLEQLIDYSEIDMQFISELPEQTVDGMLKSQQSKRSRTKGKTMTLDNYKSMMSAAIAENIIRKATGKAKLAGGTRRAAGTVEYTPEELELLAADQEQLRKEIRNVQSKKSIMKSKAGFSEEDDRWQSLLVAEEQLKSIRVDTGTRRPKYSDETKLQIVNVLEGVDLEHIKANDSKELLARIAAMVG